MNDMFNLQPMEAYTPPSFPTLTERKPKQLQKLPARWQKNAAVIACAGMMGLSVLSGCGGNGIGGAQVPVEPCYCDPKLPYHNEDCPNRAPADPNAPTNYPPYKELQGRMHWGGGGGGPFYVVYLTEQEALGRIRAQLEAAGLSLGDAPPALSRLEYSYGFDHPQIDLFDAEHGVAVMLLPGEYTNMGFLPHGREHAQWLAPYIERQLDDIIVKVFYSPGEMVWSGWEVDWSWDDPQPTGDVVSSEDKERMRSELHANLTAQVQAFIDQLRAADVID
ncbi:MAG: hypothetical protein FWE06_09295 [Oscillospiraceae bacterium]|nr:hypothetical protein [Oscillospiraceae bacterium]